MEEDIIRESSKALEKLFFEYTHLPLGGKEIVCPYWMNNLEKGIYGPIGGKGRPEEIVLATEKAAIEEKVDLGKMGAEEIALFMKAKRLGVDCSGFVFWMLDALDKEKGGNGIADDLPQGLGEAVQRRASAKILTSEEVSFCVNSIDEIKIGDLIRMRRGKHVAIVYSLEKNTNNQTDSITYAHSSSASRTKNTGVHLSVINIIDGKLPIESQDWKEETPDGLSYGENIIALEGDGIKRLKIWGN